MLDWENLKTPDSRKTLSSPKARTIDSPKTENPKIFAELSRSL